MKSRAEVGADKTDEFKCLLGVWQGEFGVPILGPLLFIIYINDLCNASKLFKMIIFDDDTLYTPNWMFLVIEFPKIYI